MNTTTSTQNQKKYYLDYIAEKIFCSKSRWPQFTLLLDDLYNLSLEQSSKSRILSIERNVLYGGVSVFAPLFKENIFHSLDLTPLDSLKRGAYNGEKIDEFISKEIQSIPNVKHIDENSLEQCYDLIIVPNLLHHFPKPDDLFSMIRMHLDEYGKAYIFDSTLREWHQEPNDYFRMTPYAIEILAKSHDLHLKSYQTIGGCFTALFYCIDQALEYLPEGSTEYEEMKRLLDNLDLSACLDLDNKFPVNQVRKQTSFPTAYSCIVTR